MLQGQPEWRPAQGRRGRAPGPGRNGERSFRGEKRSNATHAGTPDPDARLYRKGGGQPAELCSIGHALMENRNGLVVGGVATHAKWPSCWRRSS